MRTNQDPKGYKRINKETDRGLLMGQGMAQEHKMTDREVAAYMRLPAKNSYITVQRMARRGELRGGKGGGKKWLFDKRDVDNAIFAKR